ncbi:MAG: addiction module protein [Acidobacteriota bacterium]|nr:addiction module protein [Acidobacteriota bacterium]
MSNSYEEIIGAALSLPPGARAMLAEHLLESLDAPNQNEIDTLWATEVESRSKDVIEGRVTTIPSQEVFRELRARNK